MNCNELRSMLDGHLELGQESLAEARRHAEGCDRCRSLYQSWLLAQDMLKSRSALAVEPSPFFETRVMAAIRERLAGPAPAFLPTLWRQAGVVLTSILALVVILASLTLLVGRRPAPAGPVAQDVSAGSYSAEQVVMGDAPSAADENLTNAQLVDSVFSSDY